MKKSLLIAALAISMNASAQNLPPTSGIHNQRSYEQENIRTGPEEESEKIPGIYPHDKFGKTIHHQTPEQLTAVQLNDSIYTWRWDSNIGGWKIQSRRINIVYDAHKNLIFSLSQNWSGNTWGDIQQNSSTYDPNNNLISSLSQKWDGNEWRIISHYRFGYDANNNKISAWGFNPLFFGIDSTTWTYDANNNQTGETYIYFNGSAWENVRKTISTYDANKNQTTYIYLTGYDSLWVNTDQEVFSYDANNNLTSYIYQAWNGNDWVNSGQGINTFDAKNNLLSSLRQNWEGTAWINDYQYIDTYDTINNLTSSLYQKWGGNTWVNDHLSNFTYDTNSNLTFSIYQRWSGSIFGAWLNNAQGFYTYDFNNNMTGFLRQNWSGNAWVNYNQLFYTYDMNSNQTSYLEQSWHSNTWVNDYQNTHTYDANNFLLNETDKYFDEFGNIIPISELANWYTDSIQYYLKTITGIKEFRTEDSWVSVFPNPSSGKFSISSKNSIRAIEIYNLVGEKVYSDSEFYPSARIDLDLSKTGKGIYIINIYDGKLLYNRKVDIQ